jgi:acyl-CoA thioester hydrolase
MQALFVAMQQLRGAFLNSEKVLVLSQARHASISGPRGWQNHGMPHTSSIRPAPEARAAYSVMRDIPTRWMDNDAYCHINNVVYYSWFDTAVNAWLIENGVLDIQSSPTVGLVVETHCNYFASLAFPQTVQVGLRVAHIGASSVRYELAVFGEGDLCAAKGHFVHVYVDAQSHRPSAVPSALKTLLETLV